MKPSPNRYRRILTTYLKPHWRQAAMLGLLLVVSITLKLLNPQILSSFIDQVLDNSPMQTLVKTAIFFMIVALATQIISLLETYLAANLGQLTTNQLRADLTRHVVNLDMGFHKSRTPGELIERVDGDVGILANFFSRFVIELIGNAILMLGMLVMLFRIDWRVGLAMTVFVGFTLLLVLRLRDIAVPHFRKARQASAELFGFLEERLSGTEDVRANGAVSYVMKRLYEFSRPILRRWVKASSIGVTGFAISTVMFSIGAGVALGLGAYLYQMEIITIGTVYLIFRYADMMNMPIEQIGRQFQEFQQAGASIIRVQDLLAIQTKIHDTGEAQIPANEALEVDFDEVSFGYAPDDADEKSEPEMVLQDVTFNLPPGSVLGLLGRTGSGKTTLTRLLFRFYDPLKGKLSLGNVELHQAKIASLRSRVGLVTQEIQLFNASVRDNLTLFDPEVPDKRILQTIEELGMLPWLSGLPEGLDSILESGGSGLSAGEAQLLAFVRVFLHDPGLVILDEASSRLDPATEQLLDQAVERLLAGRTAIIIAHRLGTVQRADRILILEGGRQVEYGKRENLSQDPESHFAGLLRTGLEEALV